ncbi:MAG TPA: hypothetical protein VEK57_21530 [Thermoanaerobaculia bacterium]|nr:hypothetical protein [Thermoanaerobaculia bacterium]
MQRVLKGWRCAAVLAFAVVLLGFESSAAGQSLPTDPPEHRILPPIPVAAQHRILPPIPAPSTPIGTGSRIRPPVAGQHRIQPPIGGATAGEQTPYDMFMAWLRAQFLSPAN